MYVCMYECIVCYVGYARVYVCMCRYECCACIMCARCTACTLSVLCMYANYHANYQCMNVLCVGLHGGNVCNAYYVCRYAMFFMYACAVCIYALMTVFHVYCLF